jgi:hypothetical protein
LVLGQGRHVDQPLDTRHGHLLERRDAPCKRVGELLDLLIGDQAVHVAILGSQRGGNVIATEQDLQCAPTSDQAPQSGHRPPTGDRADAHLELTQHGLLRREPDIGSQRELAPGAASAAAKHRDRGHWDAAQAHEIVQIGMQASRTGRHRHHASVVSEEVPVSHEVARLVTAEDHDIEFRLRLQPVDKRAKLLDRVWIEQVYRPVIERHPPIRRRDLVDMELLSSTHHMPFSDSVPLLKRRPRDGRPAAAVSCRLSGFAPARGPVVTVAPGDRTAPIAEMVASSSMRADARTARSRRHARSYCASKRAE